MTRLNIFLRKFVQVVDNDRNVQDGVFARLDNEESIMRPLKLVEVSPSVLFFCVIFLKECDALDEPTVPQGRGRQKT